MIRGFADINNNNNNNGGGGGGGPFGQQLGQAGQFSYKTIPMFF